MDSAESPRVLVVDDTALVRDLFGRFLTTSGMSVTFAEDGLLGLAQARAHRPDAVVCDLDMPHMGGLELCRALRSDPATHDVPVVLVSGHASTSAQAALEAGCNAVLAKPCSRSLLVSTIRRLLAPAEMARAGGLDVQDSAGPNVHRQGEDAAAAEAAHVFLLVEADPSAARIVRRAIAEAYPHAFEIVHVTTLAHGLDWLRTAPVEAVLLNLFVVDSDGLATLEAVRVAAPRVPVLVLCAATDEDLARRAVDDGAWEYLVTTTLQPVPLTQALRRMVERRRVEEALSLDRERAQDTLDSIGDAVVCTDPAGRVTFLNAVAEELTGWRNAEATGRPFVDVLRLIDAVTRLPAPNPMELALTLNTTVGLTANCVLMRRDGIETAIEDSAAPLRDRLGRVTGAVMVLRDVSASRAHALALSHRAQHDVLTDLPNRTLLNDRLRQAIAVAKRHGTQVAVLFLDVDRFKEINDSLGHGRGDELLQSIAARLLACVRGSDTVCRQGGDEFVILLTDLVQAADAIVTARKIIATVSAPHHVGGLDLEVTASIGISMYPRDGEDGDVLITHADYAMYRAKSVGANTYHFFDAAMSVPPVEWRSIRTVLENALARGEFELHYQPTVRLDTGAIVGAEALIRWRHPERGLVLPDSFVPLAEACGLVGRIGHWVVREACRQARAWQVAGLPRIPVAVNVSALEFRQVGFLSALQGALAENGLEPRDLELEVTERVLMPFTAATVAVLLALKTMGIRVAIDDFGAGYSNLSYLRQFPVAVLKIDGSFVREITDDPDGAPIVTALIGLGKSLMLRVVAEGVETPAQLAFLRAHDCPEAQGRLFSEAVTAEQFGVILRAGLRG